jgi:hypothetical protein
VKGGLVPGNSPTAVEDLMQMLDITSQPEERMEAETPGE